MPSVRSFMVLPKLPQELKDLEFLANNMYWSWNPEVKEIFKHVDSSAWEKCGHNPIKLLGSVSQHTLDKLSRNQSFIRELGRAVDITKTYLKSHTWFDTLDVKSAKPLIAYFSAEFGIHECLPIYSGGLGILAGDHLKSASDLGLPLVGIGLMYQKGYFRQYLNLDGWQQEIYAENDFYKMPAKTVKDENGNDIMIDIPFPQRIVKARIWQVNVGRIKLYLLDTNLPSNSNNDRVITQNLYGGGLETRICQEIVLGIGGLKALTAMGIEPTVCHMNEGHAAFMALERIRELIKNKHMTFDEALETTKASNTFTVHTPVKAGNDEFPREMIQKYFAPYLNGLEINFRQLLDMGRINTADNEEPFKMPVLAIKTSAYKNGVSKLHGEVSRKMWSGLWPRVPINEVPIGSVTNGVHIMTWLSDEINDLYNRYIGPNWSENTCQPEDFENIDQIPDEELWRTHQRSKEQMIGFIRNRLTQQLLKRGSYHSELNWAQEVLDPEALTIGFARRFATYKRGNLLLKDPQRLIKILTDSERPVQIIFAGKAHPKDAEGKDLIRQIVRFASQYNVKRKIVFIEDYDIDLARYMVRGVDIWLNNPRPPMEASGTSGMKAAFNGALNMSTFDGWWCEGYQPQGGWVIGSGESYDDTGYQDKVESQAIYNLLENEAVPLFYTRATDGLPRAWIHRMKNSMKFITPRFNTNRMVSEYTEKFYAPAAKKWRYLTAESMARAKALAMWTANMKSNWDKITIKDVKVEPCRENSDEGSCDADLEVGSKLDVSAV
ncbi:MAG: alpha-glucan family phosphorylase, partial [Planctomycetes bacterium]|nr:alpha-glucan family phosphorylase [Planctomycetota bacterium]